MVTALSWPTLSWPPSVFGYSKIGPYPYDPEKAKELLAEAGYADGLEITVMLNEDRDFINVVEIAQNMWKEVGITTNIEIMDQATLLSKAGRGYRLHGGDQLHADHR